MRVVHGIVGLVAGVSLPAATLRGQQVRDSAGTRIVRYAAGSRAPATWRTAPQPLTVVGGAEGTGPSELARVIAVYRQSNGVLAIANRTANELRYFAANGTHLRTVGRKGQGPSEFDNLSEVHRSGDTLAVGDRSMRLQIIGPGGELLRAYGRAQVKEGNAFGWSALLPDGAALARVLDKPADLTADHITATITYARRPSTSDETRFFLRERYTETERANSSVGVAGGGAGHTPLWIGPSLKSATAGGRFCSAYGDAWQVSCYDAAGREVFRTRRESARVEVSAADRATFDSTFRVNMRAMSPSQLDASLRSFRYARYRDRFGRFVGTTHGELWVGEHVVAEFVPRGDGEMPYPTRESRWSVLGADGRWIADAILPPRFTLMDAGRDWVAGVLRDADDVEQVVVYRLTRS